MKIVSVIEATTVNAVAKNAIEFICTARELARTSPDVPHLERTFLTFERHAEDSGAPNEFVLAARRANIEVDVIPEKRRFDLSVIPALRTAIEHRQPDLITTHSVKSHFLLWRSGLSKKYPWLAFHHGYTTTDRKMRLYNRLDRWSLPKADRVVTVCHAFAHNLSAITNIPVDRILVQHNAVRPKQAASADSVQTLREKLGLAADERVILSVGRLSQEKAHADLIAAFAQLSKTNPNLKLVIAGDGPERSPLESLSRQIGDGERIVFAGQVSDVQPFYGLADIFVLPSHREGSPNALLEAMAAGVPVVATTVGGVPEIVTDGENALLVPPHDISAMAQAVARVLSDINLSSRLSNAGEMIVKRDHTPARYVQSLAEIFHRTISDSGRAVNI